MSRVLRSCGLAALILSPALAGAQDAPPVFRSAFESYQPFNDQEVAPWKQSNERVREAGGWRAYAREAAAADPADATTTAPAAAPAATAPAAPAAAPRPAAPAAQPAHRH